MGLAARALHTLLARWFGGLSATERPWAVDRLAGIAWDALDPASRTALWRSLGARLGAASYTVPGPLGTFEGGLHDTVVLDWYLRHGSWETWLQRLQTERLFPDGTGTWIDIGANIGMTCIPLARRTQVQCHAFEPEPSNHGWLQGNVVRNGVAERVTTYPLALYSEDGGDLAFEVSGVNLGDHKVRPEGAAAAPDTHLIRVPRARLDSVLGNVALTHPLAVKLDTQGAEMRVLLGGPSVLTQADVLVAEVNPALLAALGDSAEALIGALEALGFAHGRAFEQDEPDPAPDQLVPLAECMARARTLVAKCRTRGEFNLVLARRPFDQRASAT